MALTLITAAGEIISPEEGGPFQHTLEGFNTGLAVGSTPLSQWDGAGASYSRLYETQPWVAIAVNFLTRQLARLPLKVFEPGSEPHSKRRVTSGPLYEALRAPAPRCGPIHLKQWLFFPTLLHGNGAVEKVRRVAGATPSGFRPLAWRALAPKKIGGASPRDPAEIDYWRLDGTPPRTLDPDDVVHLAWHSPSGVLGTSPLKQVGVTLRHDRATRTYQEALFANSARPSGGVTLPENELARDREYRQELRADLARLHQGAANAGRPVILPPGSKWEQFSITAHEAELIEQRKLDREEIAAIYNAPQPLIGILDKATYSNISEQHKMLYGPVLGPWITLGEETLTAQVIDGEPAFAGQFVEFDLAEELRGDILREAQALKLQLSTGMLTINEARAIRNLPPIDHPDCDRAMIQANNMQFVGGDGHPIDDGAQKALTAHLERACKAAEREDWDAGRFGRELRADLATVKATDPDATAQTWARTVDVLIADALGDPDQVRQSLAALTPSTNGAS